jgi:glycosyltransferase involved in cell wall biosynthesis
MSIQARKMRRFEAEAGRQFDAVVAVSERDRQIFEQDYGWRHVHTIDTAVDVDYFQPRPDSGRADRVVFVGSMDWLPNADGVKRFVRQVWPQIRRGRPEATFQIVGRAPDASVRRLGRMDGVEVTGSVSDVRPFLAEAAVVVVPLYVGGGTRLKIFEAMAMDKAVVSTSLGAEGLKLTPGKHIELADDPGSFAARVVELLSDDCRRRRLARAAREYVCQNFSAATVARQFEQICLETAARKSAGVSAHQQPVAV